MSRQERIKRLEERLKRGLEYLDAHPESEANEDRAYQLWIALLKEYEALMREEYADQRRRGSVRTSSQDSGA